MADDSEDDAVGADDEENVVFEAAGEDEDGESTRQVRLIEDAEGFWTVVDSERGAVGDAPSKAAGLHLLEQVLEDMEGVTVPDVEPEEPSERPDRDPKLPPEPSMPDDSQ